MADVKNPYSEARKRANQKWDKENLYRVTVNFPKAWESELKKEAKDMTVSTFVKNIVADYLKKE